MPQVDYFDPAERQMEKERYRAADAHALEQGHVSQEELAESNGFFASLDIVESSVGNQGFFV